MKYLLDVNALIALGFVDHRFHSRVTHWVRSQLPVQLLTCSISELGFVRVLGQAAAYGYSVEQARNLLLQLKRNTILPIEFIPDDGDISSLPTWVKTPKQTTDGHLAELATRNNASLATLDEGIPGACLIL